MGKIWRACKPPGAIRYGMPSIIGDGNILDPIAIPINWVAANRFAMGSLSFCGGLYLLACSGIGLFDGFVPVGGLALATGWLALAWYGWQQTPKSN